MRVLFLTHCFIREKGDLSGVFLFDLASELVNRGTEVFVVTPHEENLPYFEKIDGISIYRFRYAPSKFERLAYQGNMHELVKGSLFYQFVFILFLASFLLKSIQVISKEKINLIHAHWWIPSGLVALATSIFSRKPYILTTHGTDVFIVKKFRVLTPLAKTVFRKSNFITAVSNSIKSILISSFKIDPDKIKVFSMPCDLDIFYPIPIKKKREKTVLSIGRLIERKGYSYLVQAVAILKKKGVKFKLIIIGEGHEGKLLKEKIQALDLNEEVEIISFKPKADLNYFYNLCDVFVLPSITDWKGEKEGLGVVLIEAMSCKKPVIGTNSGGITDIVKDNKTGLLVTEKDPEALADAMEKLLKDKKLATRLAENGYNYVVKNLSSSKITDKVLNIYSDILM